MLKNLTHPSCEEERGNLIKKTYRSRKFRYRIVAFVLRCDFQEIDVLLILDSKSRLIFRFAIEEKHVQFFFGAVYIFFQQIEPSY